MRMKSEFEEKSLRLTSYCNSLSEGRGVRQWTDGLGASLSYFSIYSFQRLILIHH